MDTTTTGTADDKRAQLARLLRERALRNSECPLSTGQLRLWRLLSLDPLSPVYNIPIAYLLRGHLNVDSFLSSVRAVASHHESFRASIVPGTDGPTHRFAAEVELIIDQIDASAVSDKAWKTELDRLEYEAAARSFNPALAPLWHFTLVKRSATEHTFIIVTHHIVADRWSIGLFAREVSDEYTARVRGESKRREPERLRYAEAIRRLEADLTDDSLVESKENWARVFASDVVDTRLPTDLSPRSAPSYAGLRKSFSFDAETSAQIDDFAKNEGVTPFIVFLSMFATSLRADTKQSDLLVITPVAGRHRAASRGVLGYFNNLLPLRLELENTKSFRDVVTSTEAVTRLAFTHQDVPFSTLAELPGFTHANPSRCLFSLQNTTSLDLNLPSIESSYHDISNHTSNFDLALFIEFYANQYRGFFDAKTDYWSESAIDSFVARYQSRLAWLLAHPEATLEEMPLVDSTIGAPIPQRESADRAGRDQDDTTKNELERRMIPLWEKVLGITPLIPTSHFFKLGGHSLAAARLVERIGREIGRELPLAALLQAPTIREFSKLIADGDDAPCWVSLVPIQPGGSKPPFFCVHGGGGGVLTFSRFIDPLGPDQPLYGLQSPRYHDAEDGNDVEQLADTYLKAIAAVQPNGPYYLAGHSFGGLIAYEMAKQLTTRGEKIAFLGVFDHPGPNVNLTWREKLRWQTFMLAQLDFRQKMRYLTQRISWRIRTSERVPMFMRKLAVVAMHGWGYLPKTEQRLNTIMSTMKSLDTYEISPYPGPLTLFRARRGGMAINSDPLGGWGSSALGGVEVQEIDCSHMDMCVDPHIMTLANLVRDALTRAQTAHEAISPA